MCPKNCIFGHFFNIQTVANIYSPPNTQKKRFFHFFTVSRFSIRRNCLLSSKRSFANGVSRGQQAIKKRQKSVTPDGAVECSERPDSTRGGDPVRQSVVKQDRTTRTFHEAEMIRAGGLRSTNARALMDHERRWHRPTSAD